MLRQVLIAALVFVIAVAAFEVYEGSSGSSNCFPTTFPTPFQPISTSTFPYIPMVIVLSTASVNSSISVVTGKSFVLQLTDNPASTGLIGTSRLAQGSTASTKPWCPLAARPAALRLGTTCSRPSRRGTLQSRCCISA